MTEKQVTAAGAAEMKTQPQRAENDMLATLRIPSFAWFVSGTTLSNAGQWIQQVTLSWLVYDITSSGAMLGTLNLVRSIATLGLAPIAGIAIDRFSHRKLLYATSLWLFALSFSFGIILLGNHSVVWPLFLFSFLGGIGQAVSMPLTQTVVFSVAPKHLTPSAVALVQTGWAVMRSVGPAIGGFLILWVGPAGNFFVQATAYALVAGTVFRMTFPYDRRAPAGATPMGSFREGWAYIVSSPMTRAQIF
ncbi:MAG: MFS transporter, partial [Caldilineaceae bacterium]|nr:MFS transporter [Caldilineaceae bacterium]